MSLLEIDSVNFSYGDRPILSNVYLKVKEGEIVGFLGRNGCGKSTLLKVIFGTNKGESQSVRFNGKFEQTPYKTNWVKYLPQEELFPAFLTPFKCAKLYSSDEGELMRNPEYREYCHMRFSKMSGGIAKFIETLILLYTPGKFILLDEPFSFISPVLVERLMEIMRELVSQKCMGILLTDHQYKSILEVSDRLYLLRNRSLYAIQNERDLADMGYIK
jgi:lipopolysaccharide export system ATP-binding protein